MYIGQIVMYQDSPAIIVAEDAPGLVHLNRFTVQGVTLVHHVPVGELSVNAPIIELVAAPVGESGLTPPDPAIEGTQSVATDSAVPATAPAPTAAPTAAPPTRRALNLKAKAPKVPTTTTE